TLQASSGNTYTIINNNSGKVLEVPNQSTQNGTQIQQADQQANQPYQQWYLEPGQDANTYYIVNAGSNEVLDDTNWNTSDGTLIQQWAEQSGQSNQEWTLQPVQG